MPVTELRPITGFVEMLRALPGEWDDRRGEEFDRLSSDERAAIQRKRLDHLATVGRSIITAILDHGWRPSDRCSELEEWAHWARGLERTKPYAQGAILFLGMFVEWYREHTDQLPPDAPVLGPLNVHLTGFRPEDVPREDFTKTCEAIAWLMETTTKQGLPIDALGSGSETAIHGPDFRNVTWYGTPYIFSPKQAACIRIFWEAWKEGTPWVADGTILQKAGVGDRQRLRDVFRDHKAWGSMIVRGPQQDLHGLQKPSKKL